MPSQPPRRCVSSRVPQLVPEMVYRASNGVPLCAVLNVGLYLGGWVLRNVPEGVFLEVSDQKGDFHGAIPYGYERKSSYERKEASKVLSRLYTP